MFGQFNYHRDFIKNFAEIARPITDGMSRRKNDKNYKRPVNKLTPKEYAKLRSNAPFPDKPEIREAFQKLKTALTTAPTLIHPNFDKPFEAAAMSSQQT